MKAPKRGMLAAITLGLLGISLLQSVPARGDTFFKETGKSLWGPFEKYWQEHGGLAQFGYPRTLVYPTGQGYDAQWFERALFTYNPKNPDPYKVELQLLGAQITDSRRSEAPFKPATRQAGAQYFPETQHNLSGKLFEYWQSTGGLPVYGYPVSEPFTEVSKADGKSYTVQYFERNRLELHPELKGTRFEVQLGLLGTELLDRAGGPAVFDSKGLPTFYQPPRPRDYVPGGGIVEPTVVGTPEPMPTPIPQAPALPATSKAVVYEDAFGTADLSNWQPLAALAPPDLDVPAWRVRNGLLEQIGDAHTEHTAEDAFLALNKQGVAVDNFTLDTYFRAASGEGVGVFFRMNGGSFYLLRLYGDSPDASEKAELLLVTPGARKLLAVSSAWNGYVRNQWERLTVSANGPSITVAVNGKSVLTAKDATITSGKLGLYAFATGVAKFDNFRVTGP
ncbi:MAG: DUF1080 domain-containing protein [Chloroflexota bacterium]|nr:DUF1080 domain-containing protein [Chloroflexota bacterium]